MPCCSITGVSDLSSCKQAVNKYSPINDAGTVSTRVTVGCVLSRSVGKPGERWKNGWCIYFIFIYLLSKLTWICVNNASLLWDWVGQVIDILTRCNMLISILMTQYTSGFHNIVFTRLSNRTNALLTMFMNTKEKSIYVGLHPTECIQKRMRFREAKDNQHDKCCLSSLSHSKEP